MNYSEACEMVRDCGGIESCIEKFAVREKFRPKAEYFAIHPNKPHLIQMYSRNEPKLIPNYSFKKLRKAMDLMEHPQ